jgi:macrodomain Ter protein organizer (MatP/YcbG family)
MTAQQFRKPQRLTITISWVVFERLAKRSQMEGRSMSNLSSYILERHLCDDPGTDPKCMP